MSIPKPQADRIIVLEDAKKEKIGNVHIPESAQERSRTGVVVAVGPGKKDGAGARIPLDVEVGDRVSFHKLAGTEMMIEGVDHVVLFEKEIVAVL